ESEPALIQCSNLLLGIVWILIRASCEDDGPAIAKLELRNERREFSHILELRDGVQLRLDRIKVTLLYRCFVHARSIEVADLLCYRVSLRPGCSSLFKNAAEKVQIVLIQLRVNAPLSLVWWNRIVLLPPSAGVLIEVHTRVCGLIYGLQIQTWRVTEGRLLRTLRGCIHSQNQIEK